MVNDNGTNPLHGYMASLLAPSAKKAGGRKSWGIDVESVLVPYFMATNAQGLTDIPGDVLGAPLRLSETKDGEIKFSQNGRPMLKVHPDLTEKVTVMRENFVASLEAFTGMVQGEAPEQFTAQVELAQAAGEPIIVESQRKVEEAVEALRKAAETAARKERQASRRDGTPQESRQPVGATA